jgi:hypothetical protein
VGTSPHAGVCASFTGGAKEKPSSFGRLCAACDPDMIAYAQLEVMAMLPSLKVAKLQQPPKVDEADIKVGTCKTTKNGSNPNPFGFCNLVSHEHCVLCHSF